MQVILTARELANYLRVKPSTVLRWAREKKLPTLRVQGRIRFRKSEIDHWLDDQRASDSLESEQHK